MTALLKYPLLHPFGGGWVQKRWGLVVVHGSMAGWIRIARWSIEIRQMGRECQALGIESEHFSSFFFARAVGHPQVAWAVRKVTHELRDT